MPEALPPERLQPALLDRLIDDEPDAMTDSYGDRMMTMPKLREALRRDLEWLINASAATRRNPVHQFPLAARSVLNFGLPPITGATSILHRGDHLEASLHETIDSFEPRILRDSLEVSVNTNDVGDVGEIDIEITGEFCPLPIPEVLYIRAVQEIDAGRFQIKDRVDG